EAHDSHPVQLPHLVLQTRRILVALRVHDEEDRAARATSQLLGRAVPRAHVRRHDDEAARSGQEAIESFAAGNRRLRRARSPSFGQALGKADERQETAEPAREDAGPLPKARLVPKDGPARPGLKQKKQGTDHDRSRTNEELGTIHGSPARPAAESGGAPVHGSAPCVPASRSSKIATAARTLR